MKTYTSTAEQLPEDGKIVMTKIEDAQGSRNEAALKRSGNIWFLPDGSMYVYYRPTHWRDLTEIEKAQERARYTTKHANEAVAHQRLMEALS